MDDYVYGLLLIAWAATGAVLAVGGAAWVLCEEDLPKACAAALAGALWPVTILAGAGVWAWRRIPRRPRLPRARVWRCLPGTAGEASAREYRPDRDGRLARADDVEDEWLRVCVRTLNGGPEEVL